MSHYEKYLKYKNKYIKLKSLFQTGGAEIAVGSDEPMMPEEQPLTREMLTQTEESSFTREMSTQTEEKREDKKEEKKDDKKEEKKDDKKEEKKKDETSEEKPSRPYSTLDLYNFIKVNELIRDATRPKLIYPVQYNDPLTPKLIKYDESEFDTNYVNEVTSYFHKRIQKWIQRDIEFKRLKKKAKLLKTEKGWMFINKILKQFVKREDISWSDLKNPDNYEDAKEFIREKLLSL